MRRRFHRFQLPRKLLGDGLADVVVAREDHDDDGYATPVAA